MTNEKEYLTSIISGAVEKLYTLVSAEIKELDFKKIVNTTQRAVNELGTLLVAHVVKLIDDKYNAARNKHVDVIRNFKERKILSPMGEITIKRRLYQNLRTGKYYFAVDNFLGIEKRARIDENLKAKLINDATLTSFGKASELSNFCVSRQTVHNLVKGIDKEKLAVRAERVKSIRDIYVEADEDHIHLNDGRNAEVKLVYVHEGRHSVCKGRTELINAKYFVDVNGQYNIWETVADYLYSQYNMHEATIHISGDGANWIKQGLNHIPGANYRMDKFHIYKSITEAYAGNKQMKRRVLECLRKGELNEVRKLYTARSSEIYSRRERERVYDSLTYIEKNFDSIDLSKNYSCSAEGHISHVLSARLSSRPMAWSKEGAEKIAKLRAYYFNGGDFTKLTKNIAVLEHRKKHYNICAAQPKSLYSPPSGTVAWDGLSAELKYALRQIFQSS